MKHKLEANDLVVTNEYNFTRVEFVTHRGREGVLLVNIGPVAFGENGFKERYVRDTDSWAYSSSIVRQPTAEQMSDILRKAFGK